MPLLETIKGIFGGRIFTKDASESEAEQLKRLQRLLDQAKRNGDADEVKELQAEIDALLNQKESKDEGIIEEGLNKALSFAGLDAKGVKDSGCTRDGSRPSDSVIAKWLAQAPANLKSHPQWSESDYAYFREKGWSDTQIKQKWNSEIGDGKGPVNWKKNPWNDKKSKDAVYNKFQGKYTGQAGYTKEEWYECQEIEQDLRWNSDRYGYDSPQAKAARRRLDGLTVGGYKDAEVTFTAEEAQDIAAKAGVDLRKYDLKEFCNGLSVELEHSDLTAGDPSMTAKIVIAHLNEIPDYYTRLAKMEASAKMKDASNFPVKEIYKGYAIKGPVDSTKGIVYLIVTHEGSGWAETSVASVQEAKSWIDQHKHPFSYVGTQHSEPWTKDSKTKDIDPSNRKAIVEQLAKIPDEIKAAEKAGDEEKVAALKKTQSLLVQVLSQTKDKKAVFKDRLRKLMKDGSITLLESSITHANVKEASGLFDCGYQYSGNEVELTHVPAQNKAALLSWLRQNKAKVVKTEDGGIGSGVKGHITPKQIEAMKKRNKGGSSVEEQKKRRNERAKQVRAQWNERNYLEHKSMEGIDKFIKDLKTSLAPGYSQPGIGWGPDWHPSKKMKEHYATLLGKMQKYKSSIEEKQKGGLTFEQAVVSVRKEKWPLTVKKEER